MSSKAAYSPVVNQKPYRDVVREDDAVSSSSSITLAEGVGAHHEDEAATPPAYANAGDEGILSFIPPNDPTVIHLDKKGIITLDQRLNFHPDVLQTFLLQQNKVPPKPVMQIRGTHIVKKNENGKTETSTVTDFDIEVDFTTCIYRGTGASLGGQGIITVVEDHESAFRGGRMRSKDPSFSKGILGPEPTKGLPEWAVKYCEDPAMLKQ